MCCFSSGMQVTQVGHQEILLEAVEQLQALVRDRERSSGAFFG